MKLEHPVDWIDYTRAEKIEWHANRVLIEERVNAVLKSIGIPLPSRERIENKLRRVRPRIRRIEQQISILENESYQQAVKERANLQKQVNNLTRKKLDLLISQMSCGMFDNDAIRRIDQEIKSLNLQIQHIDEQLNAPDNFKQEGKCDGD